MGTRGAGRRVPARSGIGNRTFTSSRREPSGCRAPGCVKVWAGKGVRPAEGPLPGRSASGWGGHAARAGRGGGSPGAQTPSGACAVTPDLGPGALGALPAQTDPETTAPPPVPTRPQPAEPLRTWFPSSQLPGPSSQVGPARCRGGCGHRGGGCGAAGRTSRPSVEKSGGGGRQLTLSDRECPEEENGSGGGGGGCFGG